MFFNDGLPTVAAVDEFFIPGAEPLRARLYRAFGTSLGTIVYLHGGGWFHCNVETHDCLMRTLAQESGLNVLGVDYRLAPEHPHPTALQDTHTAWSWLRDNAGELKLDQNRLAIAGDSAGANLALAFALGERDAGRALPAALALFYGCYAPNFETESHRTNGDGRFGLTTERMRWYWANYAGADLSNLAASAAPLMGNFVGLPATYLSLATLDPLADDTRLLAARMKLANVPTVLREWPRTGHGFMQMIRKVAVARAAAADAARFLSQSLAR
jgi:acetyl esterase